MESNPQSCLDKKDSLGVLMHEYDNMRAEIRMYVQQYSPKFTIFATFVLSAFVFAFQNEKYQLVYLIIPLFMFFIGFVTIAQAYLITLLASKVRAIEEKIKLLNNNVYLMNFESEIALTMVYPLVVNIITKKSEKKRLINPIFISVVAVIIATAPLIFYSLVKAYNYLSSPWNNLYLIFVSVIFIFIVVQSFEFFRLGELTDSIDYEKTKLQMKSK